MAKILVLGPILAEIRVAIFFFLKNLAQSVTRYHVQLSSCTISEKTNDPILRKVSDGQTDESDFIVHCRTNFERPISKCQKQRKILDMIRYLLMLSSMSHH